ncbi:MAG TPA: GNAT family N-acetyltransferase [Bryobacteraceae bacterium]|nr:GNAT family N-acetyltransferase [Bryobacteraceae bacterium]
MEIRALTRADLDAFQRLRRERLELEPRAFSESLAEHDATPVEAVARRLSASSDDQFVMGAFAPGGQLVGMAGLARNMRLKSRHKAVIWGVYVQPTWRNQGIARGLLTQLIERARANPGIEKIMLTVSVDQIAARRLYLSLGFEIYGREKHALSIDGSFVDEDQMVLWLR